MKNTVTPPASGGVSRSAVAKHYGVNGGSVSAWVKAGCPQLPKGLFVLADVEKWLRARDEKKAERASLKDQKTQAEINRILADIRQRDHDYERQRGEVHGKEACCKSLTTIVSEALQPLLSLHGRVKAACPELPKAVIDRIAAEVDAVFAKIREGLAK
jgi:hypothetical protein